MATVLVHIDLESGVPHPSSLAALSAGRVIASTWGAVAYAVAIVEASVAPAVARSAAPILARAGADKIVLATTNHPTAALWAVVGKAWSQVVDRARPRLVLFGADAPSAVELGPRTAARLGARLLARARATAGDQLELRDRDGAYVRAADSGAAVVLIGVGWPSADADAIPEVSILPAIDSRDERIEVGIVTLVDPAPPCGVIVALGEDAGSDATTRAAATALAAYLGAPLLDGAQLDKATALAPELCIAIGDGVGDLAGGSALVRIGGHGRNEDAALPGDAAEQLTALVAALGCPP